jgi:uncharacterized DUF497 family protein
MGETVRLRVGDLEFEWDTEKAVLNSKKHGVSFLEAATAFSDALSITINDPDHSDSEDRFVLVGTSADRRLLVVVHVVRDVCYRIISARKATKYERKNYEENT